MRLAVTIRPGLRCTCGAVVALLATAVAAPAQTLDFTVSGTSSIRGWTCTAKGTVATTPGTGGAKPLPGYPNGVQSAKVTVPLNDFACPQDEMRQHLHEAMKADKFPEIVFTLEKYDVAGSQAQATGSMTITGTTQPLTFPVSMKTGANGVEIDGSTRLDMTAYGVEPPVVMLGLLKVNPIVRIQFKGVVPK
jgi:polyisoprenoid-binding protein YceI